jgi:hypothetical protein
MKLIHGGFSGRGRFASAVPSNFNKRMKDGMRHAKLQSKPES